MTTTTVNKKQATEWVSKGTKADPEAMKEKLVTARVGLLLKQPFFGNLATRLKLVDASDWVPTAATDGRNFYYNSDFIDVLTPKETEFLFGHEVLHVTFEHLLRRNDRDAQLFNIACDYAVNQILVDEGVGEKIHSVPILQDYKYKGKSSEEIYDDLYEEYKDQMQALEKLKSLDVHMDLDKGEATYTDEDGNEHTVKCPEMSKEEQKELKDQIKEAVLQGGQAAGRDKIPGAVRKLINDITAPKINWRDLLSQQIQSTVRSDFTFARPNRKTWHMDAILPASSIENTIDLCVAIDTSGSITDDQIKDFLSEIKHIMDGYTDYNIKLWSFDTEVHESSVTDYTPENADELFDWKPGGYGGTDISANYKWMDENGIVPKQFVCFTDGYTYEWGDEDYCDTLWIIHSQFGDPIKPPFGVSCNYDDKV